MTNPERETAPTGLPDTDLSAAHASVTLPERLADKLGGWASATAGQANPSPPTVPPSSRYQGRLRLRRRSRTRRGRHQDR